MTPEQIAKSGTESAEQSALMAWCAMQSDRRLDLLFAIPNGGERHAAVGAKNVATGLKSGVPDLMLPVPINTVSLHNEPIEPIFAGLFLEMKRVKHKTAKNGNCSAAQLEWHDKLREQGYAVCVAFGWIEARDILLEYLA
jgi:hypothetical protein